MKLPVFKKWGKSPRRRHQADTREKTRSFKPVDYSLLLTAMTLICVGTVCLYSSSAIWADTYYNDPAYFLKKQIFWLGIGSISMFGFARLDYNYLREWTKPLFLFTCMLLVAALFAPPVAGVRRWIRFGFMGIQPSEFAKLALLVYLADYLDRNNSAIVNSGKALIQPLILTTVILGLIGLAPDLGAPVLLFIVVMFVLYAAGARIRHLLMYLAAALPVVVYDIIRYPYRIKRLFAFLSPWEDAQDSGYQLVQSLIAIGSGGWLGKGLGSSKLKLMYLPAPHTDFIFSIICEELGLIGSLGILFLFLVLLMRGLHIAKGAGNLFGSLLALGITLLLAFQAFFNIAVSIGVIPTKGLPLPFFSYGGSSLLVSMTCIGILLNISRGTLLSARG